MSEEGNDRPMSKPVDSHARPETPTWSSPAKTDAAKSPPATPKTPRDLGGVSNLEALLAQSPREANKSEDSKLDEDMRDVPIMDRRATLEEKAPWRESHRRQAKMFRAKALHYMELDNMTAKDDLTTRRDVFKEIVTKQRKNRNGCLVLPLNIAFFVLYAIAARLHEDITNVWLVESSIRHHLRQQLENVNTIGDVWNWLQDDMLDMFFEQRNSYGEPLPESEWSRVLLYSQVQGSVILRQSRQSSDAWGIPYPGTVSSYLVPVEAANTGFVPKSGGRRLGMMQTQWMSKFVNKAAGDDKKYDFPLYPTVEKAQVLGRLQYLEERHWLDDRTQTLSIIVMMLNGELGRPRLEQIEIELQFSRGGGIYAKVGLQALFLQLYANGSEGLMSMGVDLLWTLMLMVFTGICIRDLWGGFVNGTLREHLRRGIVLMELFIMLLGWINVGGVYLQAVGIPKVADALEDLRKVVADNVLNAQVTPQEEQISDRLHNDGHDLIWVMESFRTGIAWMTLVLIFRFFTSFRVQPRLAVVTNTLKATIIDLAHFLVVFCPSFFAFAISGNILFGRRIEQFSTVQGSIGVCLRIVFENEYEWLQLSEEYFYGTAVWAWSFLVVVVMIMLNMVLAIVLDIYNEVRATTDSNETVFRFISHMALQLRKFDKWVPDKDLECFFDEANDETQSMTVADIMEALPHMTDEQRDMVLGACKSEMLWQAKQELVASHFLKLGASIKLSVDDASVGISEFDQMLAESLEQEEPVVQQPISPRQPDTPGSMNGGAPFSPRSAPKRMVGTSKPFPGVPATPGGYYPPVCPPALNDFSVHRIPSPRDIPEGEPKWYNAFLEKIKASGDVMDVVLSDLRTLHWQWHRVDVSANRQAYGAPKQRKSVCSISDLKIAAGHPIL